MYTMAPSDLIPLQIAGYDILPVSLPPLPSSPTTATHYLYLAPHNPKISTSTASRSLFAVNVPFDATEAHIKHLLSSQIGLPAGRIENVEFKFQRRRGIAHADVSSEKAKSNKNTKKRKRGSEGGNLDNLAGAALPSTWDRDLQTNGHTAVVLFVDRASIDAALKAVKAIRKEKKLPIWGGGVERKTPALGSASKYSTALMTQIDHTNTKKDT